MPLEDETETEIGTVIETGNVTVGNAPGIDPAEIGIEDDIQMKGKVAEGIRDRGPARDLPLNVKEEVKHHSQKDQ